MTVNLMDVSEQRSATVQDGRIVLLRVLGKLALVFSSDPNDAASDRGSFSGNSLLRLARAVFSTKTAKTTWLRVRACDGSRRYVCIKRRGRYAGVTLFYGRRVSIYAARDLLAPVGRRK